MGQWSLNSLHSDMTTAWREYQEKAAEFFRQAGMDAVTNASVLGVRTNHDVDILVTFRHVGFDVTWIVECKYWKDRVSKLHVLGLRTIVADLGADKGILLAENGFQSGAIEAANLTNVQVTSLADLQSIVSKNIRASRMSEIHSRLEQCRFRYYEIPKSTRIALGLRQEVEDFGYVYSGFMAMSVAQEIMRVVHFNVFPADLSGFKMYWSALAEKLDSAEQAMQLALEIVADLEDRLSKCEDALR